MTSLSLNFTKLSSVLTFIFLGCGKPPGYANTYSNMGTNSVGSRRRYYCERGYIMRGHGEIRCLPNGKWSAKQFTCICKYTYRY